MKRATETASSGNMRVGLEDNLGISPGKLAESKADQFLLICSNLEAMGREIVTPDEARTILQLKPRSEVVFA